MNQKHISRRHNWTITLVVAVLTYITASAPCYADDFGLTNQWSVVAAVNGSTAPTVNAGCYGCNGGYGVHAPVPLTNTVSLNNSGNGGSSIATMTNSADYGSLSVSGSGSATNSDLTGAFSWVRSWTGGAPLVSYTDTLHILSSTGASNGTPVTLQFTEPFAGNVNQVLPIGSDSFGPAFVYDLLQLPYSNLQLNQTGTKTITFNTSIGSSFRFSDSLYAYDYSNANTLSPVVTSSFSYSGGDTTYVTSLTPGVSIYSASGHNYAPVPEPETYAMLLAGLGLIGFITYRRKDDSFDMPMAA
jgi:hypothetical protein